MTDRTDCAAVAVLRPSARRLPMFIEGEIARVGGGVVTLYPDQLAVIGSVRVVLPGLRELHALGLIDVTRLPKRQRPSLDGAPDHPGERPDERHTGLVACQSGIPIASDCDRRQPASNFGHVVGPDFNPRPKRSDLADMRAMGVRDVLVYCGNPPKCYHQARLNLDDYADGVIFGEVERRMVCKECGHLGADMRPAWNNWKPASSSQTG